MSDDEIIKSLEGDYAGFYTTSRNYWNCLQLAKIAKEKGAKIIFGGPHASAVGKNILKNRDFIDFVIKYDGELSFYNLLVGKRLSQTPNLIFRKNGTIIENQTQFLEPNKIPICDRSLLDMEKYFENFNSLGLKSEFNFATNIYTKKGCPWRAKEHGGCIFCGTNYPRIFYRNPLQIWKEIKYLQNNYNIEFIWDISDDIGGNENWLKELVKTKPKNTPYFRFYLSAKHATGTTMKLLKKLKCIDIFIGFESNNNSILKRMNKQASVNDNIRTMELLSEFKIPTTASFVLGNLGETKETLMETYSFAKQISSLPIIRSVHYSMFKPVPGAGAFSLLCKKSKNDYTNLDIFDNRQLQQEWVDNFCKVSYESLLEFKERFKEIDPCIVEYGPIESRCSS